MKVKMSDIRKNPEKDFKVWVDISKWQRAQKSRKIPTAYAAWAFNIGGETKVATGYYKEVLKDMIAIAKERNIDRVYLLP